MDSYVLQNHFPLQVCVIVFQQLHYLDLEGVTRLLGGGESGSPVRASVSDAWMVDYLAALATICFMLFLGAPGHL